MLIVSMLTTLENPSRDNSSECILEYGVRRLDHLCRRGPSPRAQPIHFCMCFCPATRKFYISPSARTIHSKAIVSPASLLDSQHGCIAHSRAVMQYIRAVNQGGWLARLARQPVFNYYNNYVSHLNGRVLPRNLQFSHTYNRVNRS